MVNIGFLGPVDAGKTSILRTFINFVNSNDSKNENIFDSCSILQEDFSGESIIDKEKDEIGKDSKTIHPNRVVFRENISGKSHTLFAPGGDRERAVVRMGIITISRIAKEIVLVFNLEQPLQEQFKFFQSIRYLPKNVFICFNKCDKLPREQLKSVISDYSKKIERFLMKKRISIKNLFFTCAKDVGDYYEFNQNTAKMIVQVATGDNVEEFNTPIQISALI